MDNYACSQCGSEEMPKAWQKNDDVWLECLTCGTTKCITDTSKPDSVREEVVGVVNEFRAFIEGR